ncbi:MAG: flagellar basal body rod protein FlgB [Pseudomonadota bacterium]
MAINFNNALGVHQQALEVRGKRAEILANNLVNADTPGFKARDIDFRQILSNAQSSRMGLMKTHKSHIDSRSNSDFHEFLQYRIPFQPDTGDGNSVDSQIEINKFSENALQYQASLNFLSNKFKGLKKALRGE